MESKLCNVLVAAGLAAVLTAAVATGTYANSKNTSHMGIHPTTHQKNTKTNVSRDCTKNGNTVFTYSSTTKGTTTTNNIPTTHGACVSTVHSKGHSSAAAPSLCRYLVMNKGTFNNLGVASGFPTTATTNLTNILGKLATNTMAPTNVGQCVKAYNQAKHMAFAKH